MMPLRFYRRRAVGKGEKHGDAAIGSLGKGTYVIISYRDEEETGVLFYGVLTDAGVKYEGGYYKLCISLASTSILLDQEKESHIHSNTHQTVSDLVEAAVSGKAVIAFHVTDKEIGEFLLCYEDTAWEFVVRLASSLDACVIANITTKKPVIHIGMPGEAAEDAGAEELFLTERNTDFRHLYCSPKPFWENRQM